MKQTCTRRFEWDSGHRVLGHGGKCRHIHGHRYSAEVTVSAEQLDSLGMVLDFSVLKQKVGNWIESSWDHRLLLCYDDPQLEYLTKTEEQPPYVMPTGNPTAENMAQVLFQEASKLLEGTGIKVVHVRLYETPNCAADYEE